MTSDIQYILINAAPNTSWTDDIPAIASGFIALLALITTLYQSHLSRAHNRLSVMPHLAIHTEEDEDIYKISIRNDGLGPATIEAFEIYKNSVLVEGSGEKLIMSAFSALDKCHVISFEAINTPFVLPSNQEIELVKLRFNIELESIDNYLEDNLRLKIIYKSFYGESFLLSSGSV